MNLKGDVIQFRRRYILSATPTNRYWLNAFAMNWYIAYFTKQGLWSMMKSW